MIFGFYNNNNMSHHLSSKQQQAKGLFIGNEFYTPQ